MARPPHTLLQWRALYQRVLPKAHGLRYQGAHTCIAPAFTNYSNTTPLRRPFHTTQSRLVVMPSRRSPNARRNAREHYAPQTMTLPTGLQTDRDGFALSNHRLKFDVDETLGLFDQYKVYLYETAGPILPPGVNLATFEHVCEQLIRLSHSAPPSAALVRSISVDVDAIYRISLNLLRLSEHSGALMYEWALNSCAKAKSRRALVYVVSRYINLKGVDIHRNNEWIALVKDFALIDEFPPAIMVYVKLLLWRGENETAAKILEQKILPYIKATRKHPDPFEDLTFFPDMDSPLRMYGLAIAETHGVEQVEQVMKLAALEFHEPIALTELAILQLESEDLDNYEHYMSYAAACGYAPACLYIANYYYNIFQGDFPTQEERDMEKETNNAAQPRTNVFKALFKQLDKAINKPMDRQAYRKLAIEWYELAFELGNTEAGLIWAILLREDGLMGVSRAIYDKAVKKGLPSSVPKRGLLEMETKWDDPTFNPGLPPKLLVIR